jgi:putative PIN family toxin of toxin-antitoxin system
MGDRMRLVVDTNVIVAALRSDQGASRRLLLGALDRRILMLASLPLMLEYEAVLTRPEQLEMTGLTVEETSVVLDALASVIEPVALRFLWRPRLKEPADEMVLETAVNGQADVLVTFNTRHFREAARTFGIRVASPGEIWREMRGGEGAKK